MPQCSGYMQAFSQGLAQINIGKKGKDIFKMNER